MSEPQDRAWRVRSYAALDPEGHHWEFAAIDRPGGVAYTGSQFDTWDGGGDRPQVANTFTDADINAVAMLSVEIPPGAVIELLLRRRGILSGILEAIPIDVDLHNAPPEMIGEHGAAWRLWEALDEISGLGPVSVSKLCARKRPRLLPIYDRYVARYLGPVNTYWEQLREGLSHDDAALARQLRRIGSAAGRPISVFCESSTSSFGALRATEGDRRGFQNQALY